MASLRCRCLWLTLLLLSCVCTKAPEVALPWHCPQPEERASCTLAVFLCEHHAALRHTATPSSTPAARALHKTHVHTRAQTQPPTHARAYTHVHTRMHTPYTQRSPAAPAPWTARPPAWATAAATPLPPACTRSSCSARSRCPCDTAPCSSRGRARRRRAATCLPWRPRAARLPACSAPANPATPATMVNGKHTHTRTAAQPPTTCAPPRSYWQLATAIARERVCRVIWVDVCVFV